MALINDEWSQEMEKRHVPVVWEAIQDAFENNAPEVHSYLHLTTGEVIRIVDGIADPNMHTRIVSDPNYIRIDPVSSREQYRWMERFIVTVEDEEFHKKLMGAIDGKGAFRRFKDVLMHFPVDRERWFAFRAERLKVAIEAWLDTHGLVAVEREKWEVPSANDVRDAVSREEVERPERRTRFALAEVTRQKLQDLVDSLPVRELEHAVAYLEFLRERKHLPRVTSKSVTKNSKDTPDSESEFPEGNKNET
jgi:hypothetical protein